MKNIGYGLVANHLRQMELVIGYRYACRVRLIVMRAISLSRRPSCYNDLEIAKHKVNFRSVLGGFRL